jgi:hypothetical protein
MLETATLPKPGDTIAGRYLIQGELGSGFQSALFGATVQATGKRYALKYWTAPLAEESAQATEYFVRTAYQAGLFDHPNIVEVYEVGKQGSAPYAVMEWLEGSTLTRCMERVGPLPLIDAFTYLTPCMHGVAEAHDAGIVHGDIRPAHIFICRATKYDPERARVIDFGKASPGFQHLRGEQRALIDESSYYASPEQLRGEPLDQRSDIYAFGLLLYHLLSGALPFSANKPSDLTREILSGAGKPLHDMLPELPLGVADIVERAMAPDPLQRFQDLRSMLEALQRFDLRAQTEAHNDGTADYWSVDREDISAVAFFEAPAHENQRVPSEPAARKAHGTLPYLGAAGALIVGAAIGLHWVEQHEASAGAEDHPPQAARQATRREDPRRPIETSIQAARTRTTAEIKAPPDFVPKPRMIEVAETAPSVARPSFASETESDAAHRNALLNVDAAVRDTRESPELVKLTAADKAKPKASKALDVAPPADTARAPESGSRPTVKAKSARAKAASDDTGAPDALDKMQLQ